MLNYCSIVRKEYSNRMKTIIFTQRVDVITSYNERRDCADQRISDFLWQCGYMPIPVQNNPDIVTNIIGQLKPDGIVLTGGNSLVRYGGNAPERDAIDSLLIKMAIENDIPLYGFCRGMQSILEYFDEKLETVKGHVAVRMKLAGKVDPLLGDFNREVNSYHNQGCLLVINPEIEVMAKSIDGVVKAIKHARYRLFGTMWHPERDMPYSKVDIAMVKNFFN